MLQSPRRVGFCLLELAQFPDFLGWVLRIEGEKNTQQSSSKAGRIACLSAGVITIVCEMGKQTGRKWGRGKMSMMGKKKLEHVGKLTAQEKIMQMGRDS